MVQRGHDNLWLLLQRIGRKLNVTVDISTWTVLEYPYVRIVGHRVAHGLSAMAHPTSSLFLHFWVLHDLDMPVPTH
jgi:hypothetical protein